jgi:hypothetical protein
MNAMGRKQLENAERLISEAKDMVAQVHSDEQDAYDDLPKKVQSGEGGEKMQETINALREAFDKLEGAESDLDTVRES